MVLTINSFISILQTINVLWERGKRGKSLEFWLKIPAAVSRALMIHGRPLSCLKVNSLLMVCPLPGPDTECRSCLWGERGPGGGARQLGRAASVASGFVISGAYPVWSDPGTTPGPLSTTGSVQTGNLARYICHKNVTSLSTSSRCKLSIVYWINIGPYFGFQSCSYYQYLMMLVTQDNRWHAGYPGGRTNAVLKGDRGLFCIWWRDFTDICKFSSFSHGQWPGQTGDWV